MEEGQRDRRQGENLTFNCQHCLREDIASFFFFFVFFLLHSSPRLSERGVPVLSLDLSLVFSWIGFSLNFCWDKPFFAFKRKRGTCFINFCWDKPFFAFKRKRGTCFIPRFVIGLFLDWILS